MLLKVSQGGEVPGSCRVLSVDNRRRCVTLYDPATPSTALPPTTITPTSIIQTGAIPAAESSINNVFSCLPVPAVTSSLITSSSIASNSSISVPQTEPNSTIITSISTAYSPDCADSKPNGLFRSGINDQTELSTFSNRVASSVIESESWVNVIANSNGENGGQHTNATLNDVTNKKALDINKGISSSIDKNVSVVKVVSTCEGIRSSEEISSAAVNSDLAKGSSVTVLLPNSSTLPAGPHLTNGSQRFGPAPREEQLCSATIKGVSAPKMFTFDGIYTHDDSQVGNLECHIGLLQ